MTQETDQTQAGRVFPQEAIETFAANYPEVPHILTHRLALDQRLSLNALADLGARLPEQSIEYNRGNLPIGIEAKPGSNGLSIEDTIRHIATSDSWAVLKNIEQVPEYERLLMSLLEELRPTFEAKTGEMLMPQGFIFISSPNSMTPYHFDPEHNILLQLAGSKTMTQFPAGDPRFAPDQVHETYHMGGARELPWDDALMPSGTPFTIAPGQAVFVPVMAPHFVRNGPESSISLSITWRSEWSFSEAYARCFNSKLRGMGMSPSAPGRWPAGNRMKSTAWRVMRRLSLT